jgi:hypothetical protein
MRGLLAACLLLPAALAAGQEIAGRAPIEPGGEGTAAWSPVIQGALPLLQGGPLAIVASQLAQLNLAAPHNAEVLGRVTAALPAAPAAFHAQPDAVKAETLTAALAPLAAAAAQRARDLRHSYLEEMVSPQEFKEAGMDLLADPFLAGPARKNLDEEIKALPRRIANTTKRVLDEQPELSSPDGAANDELEDRIPVDRALTFADLKKDLKPLIPYARNRIERQATGASARRELRRWEVIERRISALEKSPEDISTKQGRALYRALRRQAFVFRTQLEADPGLPVEFRQRMQQQAMSVVDSALAFVGRSDMLAQLQNSLETLREAQFTDNKDQQAVVEGMRRGLDLAASVVKSPGSLLAQEASAVLTPPANLVWTGLEGLPPERARVKQILRMSLELVLQSLAYLSMLP